MSKDITAPEIPTAVVGESFLASCSFAEVLDSGETLASVVSATEKTTSDLTIASAAVSAAALTISCQSVDIGEAVQMLISGHLVANSPYTVTVTVTTSSTPAQTRIRNFQFEVVAP